MKLIPPVNERPSPLLYTSLQDMRINLGRYAFAAARVEGKAVLDIACGTGYGSNFFMKKGAIRVIGADIQLEAISYAHARYCKKGRDFILADAQRLPFLDNSFDIVVSMETIEHLPDYRSFLSECYRVLRTGGTVIYSTPNKANSQPGAKKSNYYHVKEFSASEFRQLLEPLFDNIVLHGYIRHKEKDLKDKLVSVSISLIHSLPDVIHSGILKLVTFITRFIFRGYRPVKLEDIDEKDFSEMITDEYRPFPLEDSVSPPEYLIAIGQKATEG